MTSRGKLPKSVPSSAASSPSTELGVDVKTLKPQAEPPLGSNLSAASVSSGKQLLPKAYCHGGDVAFFGGIDLEFEASINNALFGHTSGGRARKKASGKFIPDLSFNSVEASVNRCLGRREMKLNPRYIAAIQRALGKMLLNLLEKCVIEKDHMTKTTDSTTCAVTSIASVLDSGSQMGIKMVHLLSAIQMMNESNELPVQFTHAWERKVIEKTIEEGRIKLDI